jgi:hypothetical protein
MVKALIDIYGLDQREEIQAQKQENGPEKGGGKIISLRRKPDL